jgi:hypothetical protein
MNAVSRSRWLARKARVVTPTMARIVVLAALLVAAILPAAHATPPMQVVDIDSNLHYKTSPNEVVPRTILYTLSGATVHFKEMHPSGETVVTNGITKVRVLLPVGYASGTDYPVLPPSTGRMPPSRYPVEMESSQRAPMQANDRIARSCRKS